MTDNQKEDDMNNRIPVRLKKEPLLEAIWEIRFSGGKSPVADLLPGMLFKSFPGKYGTAAKLPIADIPAPVIEHDPNLRYVPKIRLAGVNQAVQIGDRVVSLSCRRPYSGWARFSADIREVAKAVQETGLVDRLERFSLKYIDLIELEKPVGLALLNLDIKMGGYELAAKPVQLRTEIKENDLTHIIQIISPAEVELPGTEGRLKGVLVDIDSIKPMRDDESWDALQQRLDDVHVACKRMFFSILKPETIEALDPEYEG
jgi:uncharacterized protein (TIGR04255 family)